MPDDTLLVPLMRQRSDEARPGFESVSGSRGGRALGATTGAGAWGGGGGSAGGTVLCTASEREVRLLGLDGVAPAEDVGVGKVWGLGSAAWGALTLAAMCGGGGEEVPVAVACTAHSCHRDHSAWGGCAEEVAGSCLPRLGRQRRQALGHSC